MPTTCNHQIAKGLTGLCRDCQAEYDVDPGAYEEFGAHPRGERNWADLQAEMDAERERTPPPAEIDPDLPL